MTTSKNETNSVITKKDLEKYSGNLFHLKFHGTMSDRITWDLHTP